MTGKRISIGSRPVVAPGAESWVRQGDGVNSPAVVSRGDVFTARLTVDVTPQLRGRMKIAAFRQGVTVADMLRDLLEREFPAEESDT